MSDEGDFKKGRSTSLIIGAAAVVVLGGGIVYFATRSSSQSLRPEEVRAQINKILVEPVSQQAKDFRDILDKKDSDERLKQEAIFQLARLRDKESLPKIKKILGDTTSHATTRVCAMALLEFPREDVQDQKQVLEKKFDAADSSDLPQITSTLVYIRDKDYFDKIFATYKKDVMGSAKGVDGAASFDPIDLAELTSRENFSKFAGDDKAGVRQLVAVVLSMNPTAGDLETLKKLLQDPDIEVSASASVGIAKLNDKSASQILIDKLAAAQKEDNENASKRYMEALKNGIGGAGLVYALEVVPQDTQNSEERGRFVLEELRNLADPSAAQRYKEYIQAPNNPPHYKSQIALALADIGDPDAVKYLADRMDQKGIGFKCDSTSNDACWTNNLGWKKQPPVDADPVTFREQQFSAQDIGDLAILYPDKKADFEAYAAPHLKKFNSWFPAPWLVVSRALAYLGDADTMDWCKKKVSEFKLPDVDLVDLGNDPKCPQDNHGCTIFKLNELATAERYVGLSHDATFVDKLSKFFERPKTKKGQPIGFSDLELENITNPGFRQAYMQASQGAADGLAEWGPEAGKATDDLIKTIKDKDQGSWTRLMSGRALGHVANDKDMLDVVKDAKSWTDNDAKIAVLMGAQEHSNADIAAAALDMLAPTTDAVGLAVNNWAARVVGWAGTKGLEDRLMQLLDDKGTRAFAALAIVLGGDEDLVRRGMITFEQKALAQNNGNLEGELHMLQGIYLDTFDSRGLSMDDIDSGRLYRFVHNAVIMKRLGASDDTTDSISNQEWASIYLKAGFKRLDMNATVPGGVDKLILRWKLNQAAKKGDDATKQAAIDTLLFLNEQGSIMALRDEAGSTGDMARRAFFLLRHPEAPGLADKEKKEGETEDKYFSKPKK